MWRKADGENINDKCHSLRKGGSSEMRNLGRKCSHNFQGKKRKMAGMQNTACFQLS